MRERERESKRERETERVRERAKNGGGEDKITRRLISESGFFFYFEQDLNHWGVVVFFQRYFSFDLYWTNLMPAIYIYTPIRYNVKHICVIYRKQSPSVFYPFDHSISFLPSPDPTIHS